MSDRPWPWECQKHWRLRQRRVCVRAKRHKQDIETIAWRVSLGRFAAIRTGSASMR